MKVGHSDNNTLPQFQWTNQALWKSTTTDNNRSTKNAKSVTTEASLPCNRTEHASCLLGSHVYLHGGKDRYLQLKDLWKFDLENGRWDPIVLEDSRLPHLEGHSMVPYRSQVFIFGGSFEESPNDTPLWIYSPDLNHVRKYTCEPLHVCPVGRREHSAVVYKNVMYIFGGFLNSSGSTSELWAFNLEEEEWSRLPNLKQGQRHGHVSVVHRQSMWVHGGVKGRDSLSDLWVFHFELLTWTKVKANGKSPSLSDHTAHIVNDSIVIVGGSRKSTPSSSIWLYGIDNNTWCQVALDEDQPFKPVSLHTSVLINPQSLLGITQDKSSQSTPHLKSHRPETVSPRVRPWTSPNPKDDPSDFSHFSSHTHHQAINVLNIHANDSSPLTDKNNNSEENLFSYTESHSKSFHPEAIEMTEFESDPVNNINGLYKSHSEQPVQYPQSEKPCKIRPASSEHCHDDIPLLERFCSVESDVDFGQHNAVITTSDEKLNVNKLSLSVAIGSNNIQTDFQYNNSASLPVISPSTIDQTNISKVLHFTAHDDDASCINSQQSDIDSRQSPNNKHTVSGSQSLINNSTHESNVVTGHLLLSPSDVERSENFFNELVCNEFTPSHSLDDLIIEDIESYDYENGVLTTLQLSSPLTPCDKSSSLKNISYFDSTINDDDTINLSHPFYIDSPRKSRSNSCSSLTVLVNNCKTNSHSLSSFMGHKAGSLSNCTTTTEKNGKYIKRQTKKWQFKHRPTAQSKSNLQKMITSKKSISTQTSASTSSLNTDDAMKATPADKDYCNSSKGDPSTLLASEASHTSSVKSRIVSSHFSDIKYLLIVLGGETDIPNILRTRMQIWKCKIC